jgi:ABC-type polysaccharide/polyol phosphate export permease
MLCQAATIVGVVTLSLNVAAFLFLAFIALWVCIGIGLVFATIFDKVTKSGPTRHYE